MKKYEIADAPGLGHKLLGLGWAFGYKELLLPDKEIVYYSDMEKNVRDMGSIDLSEEESDYAGGLGMGAALTVGVFAASGTVTTLPIFGGYLLGKYVRSFGRMRADDKIQEKLTKNGYEEKSIDYAPLKKIVNERGLHSKKQNYHDLVYERREEQERKKSWKERNFYMPESDEIRDYRINEIAPILGELEDACIDLSTKGENPAFFTALSKEYAHVKKKLQSKSRDVNEGIPDLRY